MEINRKPQTENEQRVAEEYLSSLADLNCNSKPLINMLTMLAEENIDYAAIIVKVVEQHIAQVPPEFKLPILYLIDSIVKNVKGTYVQLFSHCIVNIFCGVFEMVHEKIRERMYALRQTWNEVFSPQKLYALDIKVKRLDTNWPITAKQPPKPSIHVNPDFLKNVNAAQTALPSEMEEILQVKTRELLELKKRKLELELEQTKKHLEEQEQQLNQTTSSMAVAPIAGVPQPVAGGAAFAPGMNARMAAPGVAPAELLHQQQQQQQKMAGLRPGFIRGVRPAQQPTATQAVAPGVLPIQGQGFPQVNNAVNKLKVNPVNPALLNTMRQRDPRLARQSQQQQPSQQQQQQQHLPPPLARNHTDSRTDSNKSSTHRHGNRSKSSRSRSKSPTRHSSSSSANHRSGSSSGRSHKSSSSRRAGASSDKDRKRSESKSSTASSSSSSSTTSDRRKGTAFSSSTLLSTTTTTRDKSSISATTVKNNYDTFDIESLSGAAQKRKSSSPAASPTKSKRSSKSSHRSSNKSTRSRSRSPNDYKDVDMRTTIIRSNVTPEKRLKLDQDMDNKQSSSTATSTGVSNNTTNDLEKPNSTFTTTTTSSSSLPTAAASATTAAEILGSVAGSSTTVAGGAVVVAGNVSDALKDSISKLMSTAQVNKEQQNHLICGEKRASATTATTVTDLEEPAQKKSKSTKMDMLFGSEDVDLRREILTSQAQNTAVTLAQKKTQGGIVTPPPTTSSSSSSATTSMTAAADESELSLSAAENWDNDKHSPKKNAMLDEIRAKLAKAAKSNKLNKNEKPAKDQAQRFKLAELNINDDSQEANDEKIRIILTQAQEMFDNKGMNQDQYKDLVQKMMSINEASKLKEAKRREASLKSSTTDDNDATNDLPEERERNAARDAVLRKRIPKIIKAAAQANENHTMNDSPRSDGNDSPIYDDVAGHVDNDNTATNSSKPHTSNNKSSNKDKRRKPSKWGEQIDTNAGQQRPTWLSGNAATSNNNMNIKRMIGISRSQQMNINMRLNAPMPWQRGTTMAQTFVGPMIGAPRSTVPPPPQPPNMISMPPVPPNIPKPCNSIDNPQADIMRSITIDGTAKEIRIYNQVAIVFMQGDVPHEIGFQPGQRALIIDNMEPFKLQFNDTYKPITIDGMLHHIRFGFPSRELYIDDQWYEIYFGGPPVSIPIRNKLHILKAEGPPPQVNIGAVRRDLVIGKISMIVDAYTIVPLFLDAKVQTFQLGDQQHTIQFVDSFINVLFDGEIHKVEYGGLPKSIALGGRKYFIRFGTLPPGIVAGKVQIQDMVYIKTEAPLPEAINPAQAVAVAGPVNIGNELKTEPIADPALQLTTTTTAPVVPVPVPAAASALGNLNIDELFQKLVSSGIIGGAATNAVPVAKTTDEETNSNATSAAATVPTAPTIVQPTETNAKTVEVPPAALSPAPPAEIIHPINLSKTETIKARQAAIISTIFSGMQCSSCGVRFPPEQTIKYSQHLDWHFRQNRRERDSSRKALSRKWYYALADWIQYEEIEDLEERDKNFLEAQQNGPEAFDEASNQRSVGSPAPSCAAGPDDVDRACDMCQEKFEQFYNEELEEWHLRSAVRVDDKIYHPLCYEDYKASLKPPVEPAKSEDESKDNALNTTDDNAVDIVIKIESEDKDESKNGATEFDDDDDVIVLPNEEPSVMEIIDDDGDDEYVPANVTREEMGISHHESGEQNQQQQQQKTLNETMESDVEIQEPHIPFTDLDNYVEKELPPLDEATRAALLNVKIKEEPKDEFDEDDGFEDVGTVMLMPGEEISIQSSEDTQTHTITSSASPATIERPPSVASLTQNDALELEPATPEQSIIDLNASMDGNLETQETHNLSAAGPAPALPLASLVNKIKINITKNTSSSNSNNSNSNNSASNTAVSTTKSASTTTNAGDANVVSAISVVSNCTTTSVDNKTNNNSSSNSNVNTNNLGEVNNIQTISTIPVLCGGSTVVPKITTTSMSSSSTTGGTGSAPANISTISVIGSSNYGISNTRFAAMMSKPTLTTPSNVSTSTTSTSATTTGGSSAAKAVTTTRQATPPPAAEPEPTIVFKPALRNIALKKTKKIVNGVETSGLCSIM